MSKNHILALMCGVVVMTVIDLAIVNTALPSIQTDLGADPADLQWVVVIYGIFVAGFLLLGGRMGDLTGPSARADGAAWRSSPAPRCWAGWPVRSRC